MKFKILNFVGRITLFITCQISFIIAMEVFHLSHYSESAIKETTSRSSYLNNDNNLFLSKFFHTNDKSEIVIRHLREVDLNNAIDQGIDKLNIQITNLTEVMNKEGNNKMQSNTNFTFGHPNSNGTFANLNDKIKKIKEDIERIKSAPNVADSSKLKLRALEQSMVTLQKLFDDKNREFVTHMGNLESIVDGLTSSVSDIRRELDHLNIHLLPTEIIRDIKGRDFGNAIKKIQQLNNLERQVNFVIHEVYNNNEGNLDLILKFANSSNNAQLYFLIYNALVYEIETNNHTNRKELFSKIIQNLERDTNFIKLLQSSDILSKFEPLLGKMVLVVLTGSFQIKHTNPELVANETQFILSSLGNALTFGLFNK